MYTGNIYRNTTLVPTTIIYILKFHCIPVIYELIDWVANFHSSSFFFQIDIFWRRVAHEKQHIEEEKGRQRGRVDGTIQYVLWLGWISTVYSDRILVPMFTMQTYQFQVLYKHIQTFIHSFIHKYIHNSLIDLLYV